MSGEHHHQCPRLMSINHPEKFSYLPEEIRDAVRSLAVDRHGLDSEAYMVTENIIQAAHPNQLYRLGWHGLRAADNAHETPLPEAVEPPLARVKATWTDDQHDEDSLRGNILGSYGRMVIDSDEQEVRIPIAPTIPSMLAFYGARLITVGDVVQFDTDGELPVTVTTVGETYADKFLMQEQYGGGAYLEYHDRPHFHMPLEPDAHGYLVLGNKDEGSGEYRLSAFGIPYGYAIAMAPYTIHDDAYLVGKYLVIYSVTKDFSTVLLRNKNDQLTKLSFEPCVCK